MKKRIDKRELRSLERTFIIAIIFGLITSSITLFMNPNLILPPIIFFITMLVVLVYDRFAKVLKNSSRIKKLEDVFPDFLQLMASNLRAGMTIDKSMLLSARPEFAPLDQEIFTTGKDITTGRSIEQALYDMGKRIKSEKIEKTIILINSGIRAGGNLAILLEETSVNMREKNFVEKKAASSVGMYVIFIFLAVSMFAPILFSLSTVLVEVLSKILSSIPDTPANTSMPFTMSKVDVSVEFIKYFALSFMVTIDFLASLVLGLVSKGDEKQGLKYFTPILVVSIIVFFVARIFILGLLSDLL
jgi:archaeal flagellar protein FlaJ